MSFARRLYELRKGQGLSQEKLAGMVGLHRVTIVNYEKGEREPEKLEIVLRLARALNTTTDYLLGHTNERFPSAVAEARAKYLAPTGDAHVDKWRRILLELLDKQKGPPATPEEVESYVRALAYALVELALKAAKDDEQNEEK